MERKIGEVFEYQGKKIRVEKSKSSGCDGCFFKGRCHLLRNKLTEYCQFDYRTDDNDVIFVEITEEQQTELSQDELPQKLNLCEVLEHCPKGEQFWSPMLGGVKFSDIDDERQMIIVETVEGHFTWEINADGTITINETTSPEIMLYPNRTQRDWTKVKYEFPLSKMPRTWYDYLEMTGIKGEKEDWDDNETRLAVRSLLKPITEDYLKITVRYMAMIKLYVLRDFYRQGWKPAPRKSDTGEWIISNIQDEHGMFVPWAEARDPAPTMSRFLTFQDEATAMEFCKNFDGLIRIAGDLI